MVTGGGRDERVMSLLDLALALPDEDREAYLRHACEGDQALYAEVNERVYWERKMNGFLREPLFPRTEREEPFNPGDVAIDRFEIRRKAGEGGMAVVYEAFDRRTGQCVAIKCPKAGFRRRLPPELSSALQVTHRNVCRLYDIYQAKTETGDVEFLSMEFLSGRTLHERIAEGPIPPVEAERIAGQICAGLAEAHSRGIVHGDLKPSNIILATDEGGAPRAVITDFGLAQPVAGLGALASSTSVGMEKGRLRGTPDFIAPELWKGAPLTVSSDIYALGVILYELASGKRPFEGKPVEARFDSAPPAPGRWDRAIMQCLSADPVLRPSSAAAVAHLLNPPAAAPPAIAPPAGRRKTWAAAAAVAGIALVSVESWLHGIGQPKAPPARLAVLDLASDPDAAVIARGVMVDVSDRLQQLAGKRENNLLVIPVSDAARENVANADQASGLLGATHAITGHLRTSDRGYSAKVEVWDIGHKHKLNEFSHDYSRAEIAALPRALVGAVSTALRLRTGVAMDTIAQAAYADYVEGLNFLRRDLESADQAIASLTKAAASDPNSPLPLAALAEAQALKATKDRDRDHWMDEARKSAGNAAARNPDAVEVLLATGYIKYLSGDHSGALADYRRAAERKPADADVQRRLGQAYEESGSEADAVRSYKAAIELQPGYFKPYLSLGNYYLSHGNFDEAATQYQRAVLLTPDRRAGHYNLAAALLEAGRLDDAEKQFLIGLRPKDDPGPLIGLAAIRTFQHQYPDAVAYCERARAVAPNSAVVLLNLADAYRHAGQNAEAAKAYKLGAGLADKDLVQKPNDPYRRALLAYLAARSGDTARAHSEALQVAKVSRGNYHVLALAILTFESLGLREESLKLAEMAPKSVLASLSRQPDLSDLVGDRRFIQVSSSAN